MSSYRHLEEDEEEEDVQEETLPDASPPDPGDAGRGEAVDCRPVVRTGGAAATGDPFEVNWADLGANTHVDSGAGVDAFGAGVDAFGAGCGGVECGTAAVAVDWEKAFPPDGASSQGAARETPAALLSEQAVIAVLKPPPLSSAAPAAAVSGGSGAVDWGAAFGERGSPGGPGPPATASRSGGATVPAAATGAIPKKVKRTAN